MPITDEFTRLTLDNVFVDRDTRQRRGLNTKNLVESIRLRGVLQPIIVERGEGPPFRLIAGERRLTASRELGLPTIPARFIQDLDPIEAQIIELEENIKRSDLEWQEVVKGVAQIHGLYLGRDAEWTYTETAEAIGLTQPTISVYMRVAASWGDERVQAAGTVREAYNLLVRRDMRLQGDALADLLDDSDQVPEAPSSSQQAAPTGAPAHATVTKPTTAPHQLLDSAKSLLHEDFVQWAPRYSGAKFNLLHCDFPYGINVFSGAQGGGRDNKYPDGRDVFFELLECLCSNLDRIMSISGHLLFWYSARHQTQMMQTFRTQAPSLVFQPHPLIWVKSDNVGIVPDTNQGPRHIYETCLMATRGSRQIVRITADVYSAPTDKRYHVSAKPEPMLRHFMSMLVDNSTRLLDPTCGSGTALRAAESLGATSVLGMDNDEQTVGTARMLLRQSRVMRTPAASKHD